MLKNIKGSVIVEKVLLTITSIFLCIIGTTFINKTINDAIYEQNIQNTIVKVENYTYKNDKISVSENSIKINIDEPIYSVYIDIFAGNPLKWHSSPPFNTKITVPENCGGFQITYCVLHTTRKYYAISFDSNLVKGKTFYFMADVSPDKKTVSNIRIVYEEINDFKK